jgi:hypothetical protein
MTGSRAMAFGLSDFSFFSPPPRRPSRPDRRIGRGGIVTALLRTIRDELDLATRTPAAGWMPRISSNYPY